jgi:hypothetical protein
MGVGVWSVMLWLERHAPPVASCCAARRSPIRPAEVGLAVVVAACCVAANALAVALVEPLSPDHAGPLALAYHHVDRPLLLLPLLLPLFLLLSSLLRGAGRMAMLAFVGAGGANVASMVLWSAGLPDYIVFRRLDVIANLSDLLLLVSVSA